MKKLKNHVLMQSLYLWCGTGVVVFLIRRKKASNTLLGSFEAELFLIELLSFFELFFQKGDLSVTNINNIFYPIAT